MLIFMTAELQIRQDGRYDTLTVYGNVNLRADFEPVRYRIRYMLTGGIDAGWSLRRAGEATRRKDGE